MAAASTLAVSRASAPDRASSLTQDGLGRAHGQRGAQAASLAVGRHRDEGDLAAAGRVDQLERHLDAVGVGLVEDELAVALEGVVGIQLPGLGRVRDLLHADDDVHGRHAACRPASGQIAQRKYRAVTERARTGGRRRVRPVRAAVQRAAAGQLVGLVGDAPRPGRDPEGAVGRPRRDRGRDQPARPRHPAGPGRGRRRASTSSSCSAATARSTRRPTAWPAPLPRSPPLPGGSTNVFARTIGLPNDPIEATGVLLDALAPAVDPPGRPGVGQRPLLPVPRRRRASTPRWSSRSSGGRSSSARPATRCSSTPGSTPGSATTTAAGPGSRCTTPTGSVDRRRLLRHRASTPTRTRTSATGRSTWPRRRRSTGAWRPVTVRTLDFGRFSASSARPSAREGAAPQPVGRLPHRPRGADGAGLRAVPLPGRRRLPRRGRGARVPPRARRPRPRAAVP